MTVYVDDAIHRWRGKLWCHLFSEDLDELHEFARRLGLKRYWFQQPPKASWCHYDISEAKRRQAINLGALPVDHWKTLEVAHGRKFAKRLRRHLEASVASRQVSERE